MSGGHIRSMPWRWRWNTWHFGTSSWILWRKPSFSAPDVCRQRLQTFRNDGGTSPTPTVRQTLQRSWPCHFPPHPCRLQRNARVPDETFHPNEIFSSCLSGDCRRNWRKWTACSKFCRTSKSTNPEVESQRSLDRLTSPWQDDKPQYDRAAHGGPRRPMAERRQVHHTAQFLSHHPINFNNKQPTNCNHWRNPAKRMHFSFVDWRRRASNTVHAMTSKYFSI